jgi:hypothetical protein
MRPHRLKLASVSAAPVAAPEVSLRGAHRTPEGVFDSVIGVLRASGVRLTAVTDGELATITVRSALKLEVSHINTPDWIDGMTLHPVKSRRGVWRSVTPSLDVVFVGVDAHAMNSHPDHVRAMAGQLAHRLSRSTVTLVADIDQDLTLAEANAKLCGDAASLDLVVASHEHIDVLVAAASVLSGAAACSARLRLDGALALFEDMSESAEQSIGLLAAAELLLTLLGAHDSAERLEDATEQVLNAGMCTRAAPTLLPYGRELGASELIDMVAQKIKGRRRDLRSSRPQLQLVN